MCLTAVFRIMGYYACPILTLHSTLVCLYTRSRNTLNWCFGLWSVLALGSAGDSAPLPWLPILNPTDIIQLITDLLTLLRFTLFLPECTLTGC